MCVKGIRRLREACFSHKLLCVQGSTDYRCNQHREARFNQKSLCVQGSTDYLGSRLSEADFNQKELFRFNVLSRLPAVRVRISHPHRVLHFPSPLPPPYPPSTHTHDCRIFEAVLPITKSVPLIFIQRQNVGRESFSHCKTFRTVKDRDMRTIICCAAHLQQPPRILEGFDVVAFP